MNNLTFLMLLLQQPMEITHHTLRFFWSKNRVGYKPDQSKDCYAGLDSCWLWSGSLAPDGYGKVKLNNKFTSAHRLSWMIHHGEIPEGKIIMHKCDNRACVNPNHLHLGTTQENTIDCINKKRKNPAMGEKLPQSKLNEVSVKAIRDASRRGVSQAKIAKTFGLCQQAIHKVVSRKTWNHVN